ncbi:MULTISPECIES: hypothetical protein [Prevotellaceae]|uniref:hypothetical protein n=1 Tax=Prevotellaceae TaxID=171552 RepID=UPI002432C1F9|nr:hypothetical protein [Hoylesella timonensis]
MMELLMNILLLLGIAWMLLGIAYLWRIFRHTAPQPAEKAKERPAVTSEQIAQAHHVLVGRSKPFVSPSVPEVPAVSPSENSADNPDTFAAQNVRKEDEKNSASPSQSLLEHTGEKGEENEMQVAYTMDEPDEDSILKEDLLIADEAMPEVSPTSILSRDIARVSGWHKNDDALQTENEETVHETLQAIRGTELMEHLKESTLKQEHDHQRLLAAIRKAEETAQQERETASSSESKADEREDDKENTVDDRPLSYYL